MPARRCPPGLAGPRQSDSLLPPFVRPLSSPPSKNLPPNGVFKSEFRRSLRGLISTRIPRQRFSPKAIRSQGDNSITLNLTQTNFGQIYWQGPSQQPGEVAETTTGREFTLPLRLTGATRATATTTAALSAKGFGDFSFFSRVLVENFQSIGD